MFLNSTETAHVLAQSSFWFSSISIYEFQMTKRKTLIYLLKKAQAIPISTCQIYEIECLSLLVDIPRSYGGRVLNWDAGAKSAGSIPAVRQKRNVFSWSENTPGMGLFMSILGIKHLRDNRWNINGKIYLLKWLNGSF